MATVIVLWTGGNIAAERFHVTPIDPAPFFWMQGIVGVAALVTATLILTTQRRAAQLVSHQLQLVIEMSVLNEQKTSKVISLIEEARRDNPMIENRTDSVATTMSTPADPQIVLEAIKDAQD